MNNKFDLLVKVALDEASLGEYMRAAGRIAGGAAKVAGSTLKGAGKAYAAIGGTQGGAALGKVGTAVNTAGKKLQDISKKQLSSDKVIADLQNKKLLPLVGEFISTVVPGQKVITRLQVSNVESSNLSSVKDKKNDVIGKTKEKTDKVSGSVVVTAQPVEPNKTFDTVVIRFKDINAPLKSPATAQFFKNNAMTRIPNLTAMVTRKEHDPDFGSQMSWQLKNTSIGEPANKQKKKGTAPAAKAAPAAAKPPAPKSKKPAAKKPTAAPAKPATQRTPNLRYNTAAPSPHTGQVAGTTNGQIYPPPSGIKI